MLLRQAKEYASVIGIGQGEGDILGGVWRVADSASALFGIEIPAGTMSEGAEFRVLGRYGVIMIDEDEEEHVSVELVDADGFEAWREAKRGGGLRDPRVLPIKRDSGQKRFLSENEALAAFSEGPDPEGGIVPGPCCFR